MSKKDFIAKYAIVLKETKETVYWWRVLKETGFEHTDLNWLIAEGKEIYKVVSAIIISSKRHH